MQWLLPRTQRCRAPRLPWARPRSRQGARERRRRAGTPPVPAAAVTAERRRAPSAGPPARPVQRVRSRPRCSAAATGPAGPAGVPSLRMCGRAPTARACSASQPRRRARRASAPWMRSVSACRAGVACGRVRLLWSHSQPVRGLKTWPVGRPPLRPRARHWQTGPRRRRRRASGSAWPSETGHGRRRRAARRCPRSHRSAACACVLHRGRRRRRAGRQPRQRAALLGARCLGREGRRPATQRERLGSLADRPGASRAARVQPQAAAQRRRGRPPAGQKRTRWLYSSCPRQAPRWRPALQVRQRRAARLRRRCRERARRGRARPGRGRRAVRPHARPLARSRRLRPARRGSRPAASWAPPAWRKPLMPRPSAATLTRTRTRARRAARRPRPRRAAAPPRAAAGSG